KDLDQITGWTVDAMELVKKIARADWQRHTDFGSFPSNYVSIVRPDGALDLYDGLLRAIDAKGNKIFDRVTPMQYRDYLIEEVRSWSYMKFPHIRSLGKENGWYRVGPLAVLNCCDFIDTPLAEKERQEFFAAGWGKPVHATMAYHWARMICTVFSIEKIKQLLHDDHLQGTDLVAKGQRRREGVAWVEGARGTTFHHYQVDDQDLIASANLIVSTTSNNEAMNRS